MMPWLLVMLGGALGSAARYAIGLALNPAQTTGFPLGTLLVNLIGCALIGFVAGTLQVSASPNVTAWRLFLITGVLGGFTTFSAFGLETIHLARSGQLLAAAGYVLLSNIGGLALAWLTFAWRTAGAQP